MGKWLVASARDSNVSHRNIDCRNTAVMRGPLLSLEAFPGRQGDTSINIPLYYTDDVLNESYPWIFVRMNLKALEHFE